MGLLRTEGTSFYKRSEYLKHDMQFVKFRDSSYLLVPDAEIAKILANLFRLDAILSITRKNRKANRATQIGRILWRGCLR